MERQTLWVILATVCAVLVVVCGALLAAGLLLLPVGPAQQLEGPVQAVPFPMPRQAEEDAPTATPRPAQEDAPTATPRRATPEPEPSATSASGGDSSASPPAAAGPLPEGDVAASLVPGSRAALTERPDVPTYEISAVLDPQQHTITGEQRVTLTNTEDAALEAIYFRLSINAAHYDEGEITVSDVRVNGAPVEPVLEVDDTALKLPLAAPLAPGERAEIELRFAATVPEGGGGYGLFSEQDGTFMLYNWHPELAVYEDGGWLLNPIADQGDPTNTDVANYVVTFAAPEGYTVINSGVAATSGGQNAPAPTFVAALTRNFVVVASDQFENTTQQVGDTLVTSYYRANDEPGGKAVLETTVKSLELFGAQFGPYPYAELDVVEVTLGGGAAGMESTGMIMIGSDYYDPAESNPLGEAGALVEGVAGADVLAFTTAHEVGHQWWYSVVGNDAHTTPWLDEGLTNWSSAFYVEQVEGEAAGVLARDLFMGFPYRDALSSGDIRLDQPVDQFSAQEYGAIVYGKGAIMYDVLREELGEATFMAFLQRYYQQHAFERVTNEEWLQTLNAVAGRDMTPFYQKWVEGKSIQESDLPPGGPLTELLSPGG